MAVAATLLAVVPLTVTGWLVFLQNKKAVERSSLALQLGVAEDVARAVVDQVNPVADTLQAIAEALGDARLDTATKIAVARSLVTGSGPLDAVALFDNDGRLIDRVVEDGVTRERVIPAPQSRAKLAARKRGFALDTHVQEDGEVRVLGIARMGARAGHVQQGYVVGEIPLKSINARLARLVDETFVDEIEDIFVVDIDGPVIAQRTKSGKSVQSADELAFLTGVHAASRDKDVLQSGPFVDSAGVQKFGGVVSRSNREWAVVVQTSQSKALAAVLKTRNIVIATLVTTAILALLLGLWLARRFSYPLEKLATMAHALAKRDFAARVQVASQDEIGLLGDTMNETAKALKDGEEKLVEETQVRRDIARYLPAELVDAVVRREHDLRLGGTRKKVVVLFADIVAFTPLTERLDPHQTVALLNELFTYLTEIIFRHRGTVDKFIGDSVMALFGVVDADEDPKAIATAAIECAEEMLTWLEVGNATWKEKYGATIRLAIGVNLGDAVVGNIGTERRMEFTAIGRTVNIAARLESVARPQQVLVSQDVYEACGDLFEFRSLGEQTLSGSSTPVQVYALET